jgi:hypothetical protein
MIEWLTTPYAPALLFAISAAAAYCVVLLRKRPAAIPVGSSARIVTPAGTALGRLVGASAGAWEFLLTKAPPVMRPGETVLLQSARMQLRTTVLLLEDQTLILRPAGAKKTLERRSEARSTLEGGRAIVVNGCPGTVVNQSKSGICLLTTAELANGDLVRVSDPDGGSRRMGWALEVAPDPAGSRVRAVLSD